MAGIIFSIIAGASMSIQGVMNTRLSDKIGIYESNAFVQGTAFLLSLIAVWIMGKGSFKGIADVNKFYLLGISADDAKKVVVAYEPIWAIGTGKTATDDQAEEVCGGIRELLENLYDAETAKAITIQYGGSMNPKNCAGLLAKPNIDGGLIGGASLKSADFAVITKAAK